MKQVILVAGVDYKFQGKGVDFRTICNDRMARLLAANRAKEDMTFRIFDFKSGEVVTHEVTYPAGKKAEKVDRKAPFRSISKANYNEEVSGGEKHYKFKDDQTGVMSVLDVYAAVQQIGASAAHTLRELSIFSHGWMGGPILVNSYPDGFINLPVPGVGPPMRFALPAGARDPDDKDARDKDFMPPNMGAASLKHFQDAFHADGFAWIWGCAFPRPVHQLLTAMEDHRRYRERGLGDNVVFTFTNLNAAEIEMLQGWLRRAFPDRRKVELQFKDLKYFFCRISAESYSQLLATSAGVKVFGALQGTSSGYDKGPRPLMRVDPTFVRHFRFYQNYLGFTFDPEGRRYGVYKPGLSCRPPP